MDAERPRPLHVVSTVRHPETLEVAQHIIQCASQPTSYVSVDILYRASSSFGRTTKHDPWY